MFAAVDLFRWYVASGALLLAACGASPVEAPGKPVSGDAPARTASASAAAPVVVELFQSQGCSSCPPANANINAIADRPEVLALSFGVTYWDKLGWADSFAKPQFTQRQWEYAHAGGRTQVATPQVIINGARAIVGNRAQELERELAAAGSPRGGPKLAIEGATVTLTAGPGERSTVWLVRYDPRELQVPINAGENSGRTLPHRNVVRELMRLGEWRGEALRLALPEPGDPRLRTAVLVQRGMGGPITAAVKG